MNTSTVSAGFPGLIAAAMFGALVLYERIRVAAHSACSYFWFKTAAYEARCVQNAIAEAVTKVNQPALSAVYNAKYKTAASTLVSQSR